MADLTITAANVGIPDKNAVVQVVQVGEAVTQGQAGYLNTSTSKYHLADSDAEGTAKAAGIFLTPAAVNEYSVLLTSGPCDLGATLTVGETYIVSGAGTAGGISPIGDIVSGNYTTVLGVAKETDELTVDIHVSGVAKA